MTITLDETEVQVLKRALDAYLVELKSEAARTERHEAEAELWRFEEALERLRARLG